MTLSTRWAARPTPGLGVWRVGLAVVGAAVVSGLSPAPDYGLRFALCVWLTVAIVIAWVDAAEHRIPNDLVALLATVTAVSLVAAAMSSSVTFAAVGWAIAAGLGAGAAAFALHVTGALGMGDVKLMPSAVTLLSLFGAGALWSAFVWTVLLAGGYVGLRLARGRGSDPIPLAPFLVLGVAIALATVQQ